MGARVCKQDHAKATQPTALVVLSTGIRGRAPTSVAGLVVIVVRLVFSRVMKEYQAVILRLSHRVREDEDALTDLLNERSRGGWQPELMSQDSERFTIIFARRAESGR
jgi:hypothetical protein